MNKNYRYRNIAILVGVVLIMTLFIRFQDPVSKEAFDLFTDFWLLLTFFFAYLWLGRTSILITVACSVIHVNVKLLVSPILKTQNAIILPDYIEGTALVFLCIGYIFLLFGLIEKSKNKLIMMESEWNIKHVSLAIVSVTLITQLIFRLL